MGYFFDNPFGNKSFRPKSQFGLGRFGNVIKDFGHTVHFLHSDIFHFKKKILLFTHGLLFLFTFCNFKNAFEENMTDTMNI